MIFKRIMKIIRIRRRMMVGSEGKEENEGREMIESIQ